MNHNRILRALNVLFLSCGYQIHWFSVDVRKFQLTLVAFVYFVCLLSWYGVCLEQHFSDASIFTFLKDVAPVLHKCIQMHLLMGFKVMFFTVFEMRYVVRSLNVLVRALSNNVPTYCSWNEVVAYVWLFSGFLFNFGLAMYIMVELDFLRPTRQQIMQGTAMFVPHFALASSFKLLNVATWIARCELRNMRSEFNRMFNKESYHKKPAVQGEINKACSIELATTPKKDTDSELSLESTLLLSEQLEALATATQNIGEVLQKQFMLLVSMNSVCFLGATYSIVYYNTSWHLVLAGPFGNALLAFNYGVFVFVAWDYLCLQIANYFLEFEKKLFVDETMQILKRSSAIKKDIKSLVKNMKYVLLNKFRMRIFFDAPITWQTLTVVNMLIGLAIAVFMTYQYFKDQIDNIQMRLDIEEN